MHIVVSMGREYGCTSQGEMVFLQKTLELVLCVPFQNCFLVYPYVVGSFLARHLGSLCTQGLSN